MTRAHSFLLVLGSILALAVGPGARAADAEKPLDRAALIELIGHPDPFYKARELGRRLPESGPEIVPVVESILEDAPELELAATEFELMLRAWAIHDPAGAANYAVATSPRGYRVTAIHATVRHYAEVDPKSAVRDMSAWTGASGDWGVATQVALVRGWVESGDDGIEAYIRGLGEGFERQRALKAYATALIQVHGVKKAVAWAEGVQNTAADDRYKLEVNRAMGPALIPFDLAAAKGFCERHCEGEQGSNVRTRIANRWSQDDPIAALRWLQQHGGGQDTELATRVVYAKWAGRDRDAAVAWMDEQCRDGVPKWLESAIPVHAQHVAETRPLEGVKWAITIEDEGDRESILMEVARTWREKDEAAADAWLDSSDALSAEAVAKVRTPGPLWRRGIEAQPGQVVEKR